MNLQKYHHSKWALLFCLALLFTYCSRPPRVVDFQGHRGARGLAPENTLVAFKKALSYPEVRTLELDIVFSKDHQAVISHEPWLNPHICRVDSAMAAADPMAYNMYEMTLDSIRSFDCGSLPHDRFPNQTLEATYKPALSELMALLGSREAEWPHLNIETKTRPQGDGVFHPGPQKFAELLTGELMAANAQYPEADLMNRTTIQSFDPRTLKAFKKLHTGVKLCLLVEDEANPQEQMDELGFPADIYSPYYELVTPELINWCHFRHIQIIPWTVNDTTTMQALLDMGVDGIISDYPDRFAGLRY